MFQKRKAFFWVVFLSFGLLWAFSASAATTADEKNEEQKEQKYLRVLRDESKRPTALQTAIVRCAPAEGSRLAATVDLVAAIHIADAAYYRQLNREFQKYDAVLYELVAAEESSRPRAGAHVNNHPVSWLQNMMKNLLDLEFQLQGIDYSRKNMVHADMSPKQLAQAMRERDESLLTLLWRMMGYSMTQQQKQSDDAAAKWLSALWGKNRPLALKRLFADQLVESEDMMAVLEGPRGSALISGRNQVVIDTLRRELAGGKKQLAVFYGAGHMADLQKRLTKEFDLHPVGVRWLTAWDLKGE